MEISETCAFCTHSCTNANEQQDVNRPIITTIDVVIFPSVVKCQHKLYWRSMPTCRHLASQNRLLWQPPLIEIHQIFSHKNFSSIMLMQQSALRSVHPLLNNRGEDNC